MAVTLPSIEVNLSTSSLNRSLVSDEASSAFLIGVSSASNITGGGDTITIGAGS